MPTAELSIEDACETCRGRGAVYHAWIAREGTCPGCGGSGRSPVRIDLTEQATLQTRVTTVT